MSVLKTLRERILAQSSISVADYMGLCNQHYYATRDPFGAHGDFTTAPEISQLFGELLGAWLAQSWQMLGNAETVLLEAGPGRGTLMKDILRATRNVEGFHSRTRLRMLETSPMLEAIQRQTLFGLHGTMEWVTSLDTLPSLPLLFVANEFLDALPITQEVHTKQGWMQRCVTEQNGAFLFTPEGDAIREASPDSFAFVDRISGHIKRFGGTALFIDYGYSHSETGDTLQAVRQHAFCSPLESPGEADLTAHVDFAAIEAKAQAHGLHTHLATQGDFLRRLGAELRATALCRQATEQQQKHILAGLERLVSPEQMGRLFKVLAITSSLEVPPGF